MAKDSGLGGKVASAMDAAMAKVEGVGNVLRSVMHLPGLGGTRVVEPGEPAGIEHLEDIDAPPAPGQVEIECTDYGPDEIRSRIIDDLEAFLDEDRPELARVRWIDVRGLHPYVINELRQALGFHTLAAEDVLHVPQRPRLEAYEGHHFVVTRMLTLDGETVRAEQMSMFLFSNTVVTFQEDARDSYAPVRARLELSTSKLRTTGADFLLYVLLDTVVDHCFPILEEFHDRLDDLEDEVMEDCEAEVLQKVQDVKRELAVVRRVVWPTRDLVDQLIRREDGLVEEATQVYLRDVHGHAVQLVDVIETLRELAAGLTDLYMSANSNRMNETMQVLTVIASLFIPITFLAGVYGMNFEYMPEIHQRWAYPTFWVICGIVTTGLLLFFWRRGWLNRR